LRESEEPVRVAGAGPAGLACAIALVDSGRPVVVSEARKTVGARFTGGYQLLENWTAAEDAASLFERLGVAADVIAIPLSRAELFDGALRSTRVSSVLPFAYLVRRGPGPGTLDAVLLARALAAGVEVRFDRRLERDEAEVVSTGPGAPDFVVRETVFSTDSPDRVEFLFDSARAPGGYGYRIVHDGLGTLGCLVARDLHGLDRTFEACAQRFRKVAEISASEERTASRWVSAAIPDTARIGRALAAGEVAGSQELFLGLPLRGAIESGRLAARSLLEGKSIDELREERLAAGSRVSLALRLRFETMSDAGVTRTVRRCGSGDFRERLRRWSRPGLAKEALSLLARAVWRPPQECAHALGNHWCRRSGEGSAPPQGPRE